MPAAMNAFVPEQSDDACRQTASAGKLRLVLVTGLSGAGRTACLKAFEDFGYDVIDNLPLRLLPGVVDPEAPPTRPCAVGVDSRARDFSAGAVLAMLDQLSARPDLETRLLFLDCDDDVLGRRFTETRRRHPLAGTRPVTDGIAVERALLAPLHARADRVIDTTALKPADLRRVLWSEYGPQERQRLAVWVVSFAYRRGLPRDADLVFDARFLANPFYDTKLRPLDGRDARVGNVVSADDGFAPFFDDLTHMLAGLLPRFEAEGKSYLTIAVGCTGGQHRSVYVAERLAGWLRERGYEAGILHRELAEAGKD
jgi:UPF0042 nucleotide-binding protein